MGKKTKGPFVPLNIAVLTVSDTRTRDNDTSGDLIQERLEAAGHGVAVREIHKDSVDEINKLLGNWIADKGIDAVIVTGGTGLTQRDITPEAMAPHITKPIPGFGELFRWLSYDDVGTSTIQSRAEAAICGGTTVVFLLPGSTGACKLGMDKIILPQLDATHGPCNLTELLPRIRHEKTP
jgi:molybdenum cofactor biosynthesis protein B